MTVNRERMMIWAEYANINLEYDTLDEAIERLQEHRKQIDGEARFELRSHAYEDDSYLALMVKRLETDAEMAKRIAQQERFFADREKRERAEYERLAKKFGKA